MNAYVQIGFVVTAVVVSVVLALFFRSAVDLWHDVGSVGVPALLIPLLASYSDRSASLRRRSGIHCWLERGCPPMAPLAIIRLDPGVSP